MIDRTSRYTLLKYFSDSYTAIYLSHRFSVRGEYGIKKTSSPAICVKVTDIAWIIDIGRADRYKVRRYSQDVPMTS